MTQRQISRRALVGAAGAAMLSACAKRLSPSNAPIARESSDLDSALPAMMHIAGVPGLAIGIVEQTRIATRAAGVTRATGNVVVNADTMFEAASLSKPVFAYLVLELVSEGLLDLDKPLSDYVALPNSSDERAKKITARHALSHTTGWRNWRTAAAPSLTANAEPGSRFGYSGEGYYYLSRVVEKVTGKGLLRLTRERIFQPLAMNRTTFMWSPAFASNFAEPHTTRAVPSESFGVRNGRGFRAAAEAAGLNPEDWTHEVSERVWPSVNRDLPPYPNMMSPNAAGSLLTSANDYSIFLRHLLSGSGRQTLTRMLASQIKINDAIGWGLGVGLQTNEGRSQFWHTGDNPGYKNFVVGDPAEGSAFVIFTNGQNGRVVYERLVQASRGDQPAFLFPLI